jgi:hypothetical protein
MHVYAFMPFMLPYPAASPTTLDLEGSSIVSINLQSLAVQLLLLLF